MLNQKVISEFLRENSVDAAFIQKDENCRYISGFTGSDSYLFLAGENNYLLTDSRYTEQAKEEATGFTVINYAGRLAEAVAGAETPGQKTRHRKYSDIQNVSIPAGTDAGYRFFFL